MKKTAEDQKEWQCTKKPVTPPAAGWNDGVRGMTLKVARIHLSPPPSFQRKLESSGLCNIFPRSGNDNKGTFGLARQRQTEPNFILRHGPALLDSSFRWNDGGGDRYILAIPVTIPACNKQAKEEHEYIITGIHSPLNPSPRPNQPAQTRFYAPLKRKKHFF